MNYGTFLKTKVEVAPISGFEVDISEISPCLKPHQKAEIERYKGVIKILENDVKDARESAVKEFAHLIIDKAESGIIHAMEIPDYVVEFLEESK